LSPSPAPSRPAFRQGSNRRSRTGFRCPAFPCPRAGPSRRAPRPRPSQKAAIQGHFSGAQPAMIAGRFPDVVLRTARRRVDLVGLDPAGSTRDRCGAQPAMISCRFPDVGFCLPLAHAQAGRSGVVTCAGSARDRWRSSPQESRSVAAQLSQLFEKRWLMPMFHAAS
jgi:hypothetical protein